MRSALVALTAACLLLPSFLRAKEATEEKPLIDVVFCLDSTGSMGSEISAAKEKIWSIANSIMEGKPKPKIRFGVVTFRDKGDAYVVKKKDLTDDVDAVHEFLMGIRANGGGDGPEDVRSALRSSVHDMSWSPSKEAIKLVFLVGDAPPHEDYKELPSVTETASAAACKGININTIACGGIGERVETLWKEIAELSDGDYQRLARSGGALGGAMGGAAPCTEACFGDAALSFSACKSAPMDCSSGSHSSAEEFEKAVLKSIKRKAAAKGVVLE